jgi:diacylglycerol kinase family enzyme
MFLPGELTMVHVIYNPIASNKKGKENAERIRELISDKPIEFIDATAIESYDEYIKSMPAEDELVIAGGDGTLNRFINSVDTDAIDRKIVYFASGSGNDFLHDVQDKAVNGMIELNPYIKNLPTVIVNGEEKKFINGIGYGIDGYCCEVGDELRMTSDKPVNYGSIAVKGLLFHYKAPNAKVTVDGVTKEYKRVWIAPTMNGRYYGGGMNVTPLQDRLNPERTVSVGVFYGKGRIPTLIVFPKLFKGEHVKHTNMFEAISGHEVTVEFDRPCALQIDGETVLGVTSYTVKSKVPAII